jgi:putative ABC transport system permease protein
MFKNYFKVAWRNLVKNKLYSSINIIGLATGTVVALLIGLWIWDEMSFDKYNKNYGGIAQVMLNKPSNGEIKTQPWVPFPLEATLRNEFGSDFKYLLMTPGIEKHLLSSGENKFIESGTYFGSQAPEMLALKMTRGSLNSLQDPASVLLSQTVARTCFGDIDPIGKIIKIDDKQIVKVTGVYRDLPDNSQFRDLSFIAPLDLYISFNEDLKTKDGQNDWGNNGFELFVQLTGKADMDKVSSKIRDVVSHNLNITINKSEIFLHPMSKWHLYSEFKNGKNVGGRIEFVWLFGMIGLFVLLLACINFMNLSTARSEKRAKEVGVRKAIGSLRSQLIWQFFSESILVSVLAFVISLLLVQLSLPAFNELCDKKISISWSDPLLWLLGFGFCIVTGFLAGSYPALYLSSFQPVKVLKGTFKAGRYASLPRKVLVVLQFTVSVTLIIGTIVVFRQVQFAKNRPIGYSRDGLVTIQMTNRDIHNHFEVVRDELKKSGAITEMAESGSPITELWSTTGDIDWEGKDPTVAVNFRKTGVTTEYGKTVGWQFEEGRDFSRRFPSDSTAMVLNEAAIKFMGIKSPLGKTVVWDGKSFTIVGVIKDMIIESPYAPIRPSVFYTAKHREGFVYIKINPSISAGIALGRIKTVFKKYSPAQPFDYKFADEEYAKKFGNEERVGKLTGLFSMLAVLISCLGLFGMASFVAEQRTKEIGLRKVLGASVFNLWKMLSVDFVALVMISCFIASPVAWYYLHDWLQQYEYRTEISWWVFVAAGACALVITLLTISFQAIKAAVANPVESLRTE